MTTSDSAPPVTILFTSVVGSAELLQSAGDEEAQRILQAHHDVLQEAVRGHGGETVKRMDDGLMVAFASAADAVQCAITMQQAAADAADGLRIRVGLNVGEAFRDDNDYFGTPVVISKRLCDRAEGGQILCSSLVAGLLAGRQAFSFRELGSWELKGITEPVATTEVLYQPQAGPGAPTPAPPAEAAPSTAPPVTILYTDLVGSTELLQRTGDEQAQRIFNSHHQLLQETVAAHGGHEVKWLGDGLMVSFPSAADAVRCAVSMQQSARRPVAGERLSIRVGLNVGEPLREEADYFGTPVVVARALCDSADTGQIFCSSLVAGLLSGRQAFTFQSLGERTLKGVAQPIDTSEILYEADEPAALLAHPPFVGRSGEVANLEQKLEAIASGQGRMVMLVGEPGIGKSRIAEEFADRAKHSGATVIWGRCYDGDWTPPYGPFAEAIEEYAQNRDAATLAQDLGNGGGPVARLVPALREILPDLPEPEPLQPDEERFRLLDAVSQLFIAASARAPLVLFLDDLHWADKGTIAMLQHVARYVPRNRILLVGLYRDVELDRQHPLSEALGGLRRETEYERILLKGLGASEIGELIGTVAEHSFPDALLSAISAETDGNPFFIREVLLHLIETGGIYQQDGQWTSAGVEEVGIPEGVRQVIGQRLSRLSDDANRLLGIACGFSGSFSFDISSNISRLDPMTALDALDEALDARLVQPAGDADSYDFTHAIIRQTLYTEMNPSRQVRLHRMIADGMEQAYGDRAMEHAADIAYQYERSASLPGAERGVPYALTTAERAEGAYAWDEAADFLRLALELLPRDDPQRPRLLGRVGLALAWILDFDNAVKAASEASDLIASAEGTDAAADYLAEAGRTLAEAGFVRGAWDLAAKGLPYIGERRDATWASLVGYDLMRREAEDPDQPGIPLDSPERQEAARIAEQLPQEERFITRYSSREDALTRGGDDAPIALTYLAGEYRRGLALWQELAQQHEQRGQIARAVNDLAQVARCHNALGDFAEAEAAYQRGIALVARLAGPSPQALQIFAAGLDLRFTVDPDNQNFLSQTTPVLEQAAAEHNWASAAIRAVIALAHAALGKPQDAIHSLETLVPALERAPGWANNYTLIACLCASVLWLLERTDHIEVIERSLREKVIAPDFRFPMQDARFAMGQLSALQGRYDEASDWFAQARALLVEQGARPLHAMVDLAEAQMYARRGNPGDRELAEPLIAVARKQFQELGMHGWQGRADEVTEQAQSLTS